MAALRDGLRVLGIAWMAVVPPAAAQSPAELMVEATFPRSVAHLAFSHDALWGLGDGRLVRVDAATGAVVDIDLPPAPDGISLMDSERFRGLAVGEGAVWVPDLAVSAIYRVDPADSAITLAIETDIFGSVGSIGVGEGSVWALGFADRNRSLLRYDAASGRETGRIILPGPGEGVLAAHGAVWVSAANEAELYRVDPAAGAVNATIPLAGASPLLAASEDAIWIWHDLAGVLERVDPQTATVSGAVETGTHDPESDGDVAVGGGYVWTVNRSGAVARVDPQTMTAAGVFVLKGSATPGRRIRYGGDWLWMSGAEIRRISPPRPGE
jgi:virginiamycin B lyase